MTLRSRLIRLAHTKPQLRPHLLPLLKEAATFDPSHYGLEGLLEGKPTTLYHGTTAKFSSFDMSLSRGELVNKFYGKGIFLVPSKKIAMKYADANRNIGFPPSIIDDLRSRNRNAGDFLQALYKDGPDAFDSFTREKGFFTDNPSPGEPPLDLVGFEKFLGVDGNTLSDLAGYILGSVTSPIPTSNTLELFGSQTGAPSWIYDILDEIGLDSSVYRPKVYTVTVQVEKTLVTKSKSLAKKARSQGYDSVLFYGADLVGGVPEVAIYDPSKVRIVKVDVLD